MNSTKIIKVEFPIDEMYLQTKETFGRPLTVEKLRVATAADTAVVEKLTQNLRAGRVQSENLKAFGRIRNPVPVWPEIEIMRE